MALRKAFAGIGLVVAASFTVLGAASPPPLTNKTLVAWVTLAGLEQRGGSVLTLEKPGGVFDAVVFGEIAPGTWMAGSDQLRRTLRDQEKLPKETAAPAELVRLAIVYEGPRVTVFRNATRLSTHEIAEPERFGADCLVLIGLRHREAAPDHRYFVGSVEDARIYGRALTEAELGVLQPNEATGPEAAAWWHFENGVVGDQMNRFPSTTLVGGARVAEGRLWLDRPGAVLLATGLDARGGPEPVEILQRAFRERLLTDPYRPGYHFVIPEGQAMPFDPNGAIFWKGRYHLFYIFQDHRGHNWGHVSSADLFHWRHHPTGLISGMFSGNCFLNAEGVPTMCYHQVGQGNAMAVALDDELNEWRKLDSNPITPKTRPGDAHHDKYRSWDPFGWREGNTYYAIFGGERPGLAKAPSLSGEWTYAGDFLANTVPGVSINEDVSCADFFKLGDRHMLLCISHRLGCRYYLGDWRDEQFHPTFHEQMSWVDNSFFAPESLSDGRGRRIMWAWVFDYPDFRMRTDFGWSGTMSLPRVLSLGADGGLRMDVPEEIERLRDQGRHFPELVIPADGNLELPEVAGNSLELLLEYAPGTARDLGASVCVAPDAAEKTRIYYDAVERRLKVDTRRSSLGAGPKSVEAGPFSLGEQEPLRLRIFVDKSIVEVFANGRQAVTRRIYPSRPDSLGVRVFAGGASARLTRASVWKLSPTNPY